MLKDEAYRYVATEKGLGYWYYKDGWKKWVPASGISIAARQRDRESLKKMVAQDGLALEHASEELKGDEGVVLAAVKQNGLALEHASDNAKESRNVVLSAVKQNGLALKYASGKLKGDEEVVRAAMGQNPNALDLSPLWKVRSWALNALEKDGYPKDMSRFYRDFTYAGDKEVMRRAVYKDPYILLRRGSLSDDLLKDTDVLQSAFYGFKDKNKVNESDYDWSQIEDFKSDVLDMLPDDDEDLLFYGSIGRT